MYIALFSNSGSLYRPLIMSQITQTKKWTYRRFRQLDEGTLGCQKAQLVCRSRGMRGASLINDERRITLSDDVTSQILPEFQH